MVKCSEHFSTFADAVRFSSFRWQTTLCCCVLADQMGEFDLIHSRSRQLRSSTQVQCTFGERRQLIGMMSGAECAIPLRSHPAQPLRSTTTRWVYVHAWSSLAGGAISVLSNIVFHFLGGMPGKSIGTTVLRASPAGISEYVTYAMMLPPNLC